MYTIKVEGIPIKVTNPEKLLWPEAGIRKIDYIAAMIDLAPYIIPHAKNRALTVIRYPDGIHGKSFFQKNVPHYAPEWVETGEESGVEYVLLNSAPTLAWLANQAALELHTAFNYIFAQDYPTYLVFDLDPSEGQTFRQVAEIASYVHETLESLGIKSYVKTSGASGLQIYIPVADRYNYERAREINHFFARYFSDKIPDLVTIERIIEKRGRKLYFDYLQMWYGKTITMVYSPRATQQATVSMPVEWSELDKINVTDFTLLNAKKRLEEKGDLFAPLLDPSNSQNLDMILELGTVLKN